MSTLLVENIRHEDATSNALTFDNAGNIGVGKSNPLQKLHVLGSVKFETDSTSGGFKNYFSNTGTGGQDYWIMSTSNSNGSLSGGKFAIGTDAVSGNNAAQTRLLINADGEVGIGTIAPDAPLHVDGTGYGSAYGGLRVIGAGSGAGSANVDLIADFGIGDPGTVSGVWLGGRSDQTTGVIGAKTASGNLAFEVYNGGWQERLRINNNGNIGIGTDNPEDTLHVAGTIMVKSSAEGGPHAYRDNDNGNDIRFYSTGGTFASPTAKASGSAIGNTHYHSYDGSQYRIAASILAKSDGPASTNVTPGRLEFYTTAGASGANPTERIRIHEGGHTEVKNGYLSAPYVVTSNWTDNAVYGFKSYNNQSVGVSFAGSSTQTNVAVMQFTIPATTGITHWNVIGRGGWTGKQPGHRLWGALALATDSSATYNSNTSSEPSSGWHESNWYESDLVVDAYSWITSSAWTNVTAGTYYLKLGAWASVAGGTCWRAGLNCMWFPSN